MPGGDLADRLATLSASATGGDGVVTVTVASSGIMTELRLDDRVREFSGARLSAEILHTMRRAQSAVAEQVAAAVGDTVGTDSPMGRAVLAGLADRLAAVPEDKPDVPVMPSAPFPTFQNTPTLPQQPPGNGFESGRDSRAR